MESIMKEVGSCGRFQIIQVFSIMMNRFVCVWGAFMMVYGNYNPGWRCETSRHRETYLTGNLSSELIGRGREDSVTQISTVVNYTNIHDVFNVLENSTYLNDVTVYEYVNVTFREYDGTCDVIESCGGNIRFNPESSTIVSEFGLICDRGWIATVVLTAMNAGLVVGAVVIGHAGERFGRKTALYCCTLVVTLSSGAAIFSPNWQTYACFIFFMATGSQGIFIASFVFATEFLNSKWRGYTVSRPVISFSLCVLSIFMTLLKDWKNLHIATCVLAFLACCTIFVVEESPRWLFIHSQTEKGEKIIQKMAKRNGRKQIEKETIGTFLNSFEEYSHRQKRLYSYLDLFRSREFLLLTLKSSILQALNVIIYHAISFGLKSVPGNFYDNAIVSSFIQVGVLLSAGPISNKIGRRGAGFLYSFLGSTSCFLIVVSLFATEGYLQENVIKISAYIAKAVTQAAIAANLLLTAETFPTAIRSVAVGFNTIVSTTGSFLFVFIIPKDGDKISFAVCYAVMGICFFVNIVIFHSHRETNRIDLKDNVVNRRRERNSMETEDFEVVLYLS